MRKDKQALLAAKRERLDVEFAKYRSKPFEQLYRLIEDEEGGEIEINGIEMVFSAFAVDENDGRLGVLVEIRRMRFLGWSQVQVRGFYASPNGSTVEMENEDLWDHGH